jgi:hypothetical protein
MNHFTLIIPIIICGLQCYRSAHTRLCIAVIIRCYMAINMYENWNALGYGLDNRGIVVWLLAGVRTFFLSSSASRPALGPIHSRTRYVPEGGAGGKLTRLWFWPLTPSSATAKNNLPNTPTSPRLHGVLRNKFTPVHTRPVKHAARRALWCGHLTFSCL